MMTDRLYRLLLGASILTALYFDIETMLIAIIAMLSFEGLTNLRLPFIVNRLLGHKPPYTGLSFPPESEQGWRALVAVLLALTTLVFTQEAWFLPWFLGFAILGAGVSDTCPMLFLLRAAGCRN